MKPNKTSIQQISKSHNKQNVLIDKKKNKIFPNNEKDLKSKQKPNDNYYKYQNPRSKQSNHDKIHHPDILKPRKIQSKENIKFPPIITQMKNHTISRSPKRHPCYSKRKKVSSMKRIYTDAGNTAIQGQQNIKDLLFKIMQHKQSKDFQASIDDELSKLQNLTKKYSNLRQDLVTIQQDMLTIGLKKKLNFESQNSEKKNCQNFWS